MEADLLQHLAKCPQLEELDVDSRCGTREGKKRLAPCAASLLLRHVPALAACERLARLDLFIDVHDDASTARTAQDLLETLSALPALREVRQLAGQRSVAPPPPARARPAR